MNGNPCELAVIREFRAKHYLTVPNPGEEGVPHTHSYRLELILEGESLDEWGYLVDIDDVEIVLDGIESRFAGELLNDDPAFGGGNPSLERFSWIIADELVDALDFPQIQSLTIKLWEDDLAWARYGIEV